MARLARLCARVRALLGPPDREHQAVLDVLEGGVYRLPRGDNREPVARTARAAILNGWQPGEGLAGVREALCRCVEFDEPAPAVCLELESLLADLVEEIRPGRWD